MVREQFRPQRVKISNANRKKFMIARSLFSLSLFAVMKATKGLGWPLHNPNANALSDQHDYDRSDLFPAPFSGS